MLITTSSRLDFRELRETEELSATSVNHYRTILNSTFNFATARKKFDFNPVKAVLQFPEAQGRDRFTTSEELNQILAVCDRESDLELKAFILIAATTGLRKGAILPRTFSDLHLDEELPYIYVDAQRTAIRSSYPCRRL